MKPGRDVWALRLVLVLVVLTGLRAAFAALVELSPDEAYYWSWSRHLAAGYFDHPPAVAWLIRLGTALLGHGELGVRLGALLCGALTGWALFVLTRRVVGQSRTAFWVALLVCLSPLLSAGSVIHTPDAALMAAWSLALWFALRAFERNRRLDWIGLGLAVGLACLAKVSGLLLVAGLGLFAVSSKSGRDCLRGVGPVIGAAVAAVVAAPNIIWNIRHQGGSLAFQLDHAAGQLGFRPLGLLEFLGGQAALVSPLLWAGLVGFMLLAWRRRVRFGRSEVYLLWCLSAPLLLAVAVLSAFHKVEANWPAMAYLAAVPGMAWAFGGGIWYLRRRRLWMGAALGLALGLSLLAHLQVLVPFLPLAPAHDPTARLRGWRTLAERAVAEADARGARIATEGYGPTSELRFYSGRPVIYEPNDRRRSQYDLWPAEPRADRLLFLQPLTSSGPPRLCPAFDSPRLMSRKPLPGRADQSGAFRWWICGPARAKRTTEPRRTDANRPR